MLAFSGHISYPASLFCHSQNPLVFFLPDDISGRVSGLRTFAQSELSRPGGAAKILPPQRAKRHAHVPVFVGGLPRHTVKPGNISRPSGGYYRLGATNPFKAAFPFFRACEKKIGVTRVLKGLVARSADGVAAFDLGGFWCGVQPRHYPLVPCREGVQPDRSGTSRCPHLGYHGKWSWGTTMGYISVLRACTPSLYPMKSRACFFFPFSKNDRAVTVPAAP